MIKYSRQVTYVGRNGLGNQEGLEVELRAEAVYEPWRVILEPVNGKGNVANCKLEIPVEDLEAVIKGLQDLQSQYEVKRLEYFDNVWSELESDGKVDAKGGKEYCRKYGDWKKDGQPRKGLAERLAV